MENNDRIRILSESIAKVIVFFDLFDYPLSSYEIWQYLDISADLSEIKDILDAGISGIESENGFYFLVSRREIILERQRRYHFSANKFRLANRAVKLFRLIPYVEMVAVSNIIGSHNLRDGSDIDLFIVTSPRRLWLTRLFCAGVAKILGWRPTRETKRNRICLSFYASSNALDLSALRLGEEDIYFNYWLAGLVPIYDQNQIYHHLIEENGWLQRSLPNWQENKVLLGVSNHWHLSHFRLFSGLFDRLEKKTMAWQLKIMPPALKSLVNVDTRVRADERIIKLYLVDRRREFLDKFSLRLDQTLNK